MLEKGVNKASLMKTLKEWSLKSTRLLARERKSFGDGSCRRKEKTGGKVRLSCLTRWCVQGLYATRCILGFFAETIKEQGLEQRRQGAKRTRRLMLWLLRRPTIVLCFHFE